MSSYGGKPTPVHGPFTDDDLGGGKRRRNVKGNIQAAVGNGNCGCELCEDRGEPVGMPKPAMWSDRPGEEGEIYLCQGPEVAGVLGQREPWDG